MARVARLDVPGLLQHVIVRGVERKDIFLDDRDRMQFLDRLSEVLVNTETLCYAWSLMPNHFHLLLLPTRVKLAVVMRRLLTGYAVTFNLVHNRVGHLFQNRYKSIVCDKDTYLLELVRYIHLNPIRAGLVETLYDLDRYPWTGHSILMGNRKMDGQAVDEVLKHFGELVSDARGKYRNFIADGLQMGHRKDLVGINQGGRKATERDKKVTDYIDSRILGDREFMSGVLKDKTVSEKVRASVRLPELVDHISGILDVHPELIRQPSKVRLLADARGVISYIAIREVGYKGLEVGQELNIGPAGVSIALRRGERILKERTSLKEKILKELAK
jgi:REP element-mobilizing transposase RayT